MEDQIHVNDVGVQFIVTIYNTSDDLPSDISSANIVKLVFRKPSGDKLTVTANFLTNGSDGSVTYTTQDGDLDEVGLWRYQSIVEFNDGAINHSNHNTFRVRSNL